MLRSFIAGWSLRGAEVEREVNEELDFHRAMLMEEYQLRGLTEAEARAAARQRFGNFERVQAQCVEIGRRRRPAVKFLKLLFLLSFAAGLWLRLRGVDYQLMQVGHVLMVIAMLGQVLVHLKSTTATYLAHPHQGSSLSLTGRGAPPAIELYDEHGRTPVERLVGDKLNHKS